MSSGLSEVSGLPPTLRLASSEAITPSITNSGLRLPAIARSFAPRTMMLTSLPPGSPDWLAIYTPAIWPLASVSTLDAGLFCSRAASTVATDPDTCPRRCSP